MKTLIDGDILVYRIGFTTETEDLHIAYWRMDTLVDRILQETGAGTYQIYLTETHDETAFRRQVYPEYKMNRKQARPIHYLDLREYLCSQWNAQVVKIIEADDALGIEQYRLMEEKIDSVIASIDKDLDMIEGHHYNFVKEEWYNVDYYNAIRNFYKQLLTGDTVDNIKGVPGIGPKKAEGILSELYTEYEMFDTVRDVYGNDEEMLMNGEVLWILRKPYPHGEWKYTTYGSKLMSEKQEELPMSDT